MSQSPAAKVRPRRSPGMGRSGGPPPAKRGAASRTSQPLGAMRKAKPIASAAWGMARSGTVSRPSQARSRVPWRLAARPIAERKARSVARSPLTSVAIRAPGSSGAPSSARSGRSENSLSPRPGRNPRAGSNVPITPASTGSRNRAKVSAGRRLSQPPRRIDRNPIGRSAGAIRPSVASSSWGRAPARCGRASPAARSPRRAADRRRACAPRDREPRHRAPSDRPRRRGPAYAAWASGDIRKFATTMAPALELASKGMARKCVLAMLPRSKT